MASTTPAPRARLTQALKQALTSDPNNLDSAIAALFAKDNWQAIQQVLRECEVADTAYYRVAIANFLPTPLNQFRGSYNGRFIENNAKQTMSRLIAAEAQHVPKVSEAFRPKRRVRMTVFYGPGKRQHDKDAFDKVAKDSLKWSGLIVDDNTKWLDWEVVFVKDKKHPHDYSVLLEIWDL